MSIENQLICFGPDSEQMESFELAFCNGADDCLDQADELNCPFYTGQNLWVAIMATSVIVTIGFFVGLGIHTYRPQWFEVKVKVKVKRETQQQEMGDVERDKNVNYIVYWALRDSECSEAEADAYRFLSESNGVDILVKTVYILVKDQNKRTKVCMFIKTQEKKLHENKDRIKRNKNIELLKLQD